MQDLVVSKVVGKRGRNAARLRRHEHRGARHTRGTGGLDRAEELLDRYRSRGQTRRDELPSLLPGRHERDEESSDEQRQPPTVRNFERVGCEERQIDDQEEAGDRVRNDWRPPPFFRCRHSNQYRRNDHREADCDPVSRRQGRRRSETHDDEDGAQHQRPVHLGYVDLSDFLVGGVLDVEPRAVPELNGLLRQGE